MKRSGLSGLAATALLSLLAACGSDPGGGTVEVTPPAPSPDESPATPRTRYSLNNKCYAVKSNLNGKYVVASGSGYAASADLITGSTPFYLKPSALGSYL